MLEDMKPPGNNRGSCKVGAIAERLDPANRQILFDSIANAEEWPVTTLAKELTARGLQVSDTPLYAHRAKTCACFRLR